MPNPGMLDMCITLEEIAAKIEHVTGRGERVHSREDVPKDDGCSGGCAAGGHGADGESEGAG